MKEGLFACLMDCLGLFFFFFWVGRALVSWMDDSGVGILSIQSFVYLLDLLSGKPLRKAS